MSQARRGQSAPGDFSGKGAADSADNILWRKNGGSQGGYDVWRANFGTTSGSGSFASVPEPSGMILFAVGLLFIRLKVLRVEHCGPVYEVARKFIGRVHSNSSHQVVPPLS